MAINIPQLVASLEAEYLANVTKLGGMKASDYSSMGRSENFSTARSSLTERQKVIEQTLAGLGYPIGTLSEPFVIRSGVRA